MRFMDRHWFDVGGALGIILTGMGRDGASGLLDMRRAGARTLGQSEASCVVYGMPKAAAQLGAAAEILPLDQIGAAIVRVAGSSKRSQ